MLWSKRRRENRNVQQQLDAPQMEHERFAERWKLCHVPFLKCALACTIYGQIWGTTATPCLFPRPKEIQSQTSKNSGSNWCLTVHHKLMSLAVIPNRRDEGRCDFGKWTPRWYFWSIQKSSSNPKVLKNSRSTIVQQQTSYFWIKLFDLKPFLSSSVNSGLEQPLWHTSEHQTTRFLCELFWFWSNPWKTRTSGGKGNSNDQRTCSMGLVAIGLLLLTTKVVTFQMRHPMSFRNWWVKETGEQTLTWAMW